MVDLSAERREPWQREIGDLVDQLGTDRTSGLSSAEAARRLARVGPNILVAAAPVSWWRRLLGQLHDALIYVLLAAAAFSLVAWLLEGTDGVPFDVIVIVAIVAINAVVGYIQEARAEEAVAALQATAAAAATVVRDGRVQRVEAAALVPGDLVVFAEGDALSADARIVEAASLSVAESALTGESEPVHKDTTPVPAETPLGDRTNMVFSGTAVARGRGVAVVTATGMATEIGHIAELLERTDDEPTPLQREISSVGRVLGIIVLAIAAVVTATILATSDIDSVTDLVDVLLVGVSLAVAAVPEGLPAVLSIVLALGVQRMAKRRAIVKDLASVETLGSATVVCSDKTGTLTRNEMTVERIVTASGEVTITGAGYTPDGELLVDGRPLFAGERAADLQDEVRHVLAAGSLSNDAAFTRGSGGDWVAQGDPTEIALLVAEAKLPGLSDRRTARFERVGEIPFTSERKLMTTLQVDAGRDRCIDIVTKGAPDVLLARCSGELVGDRVVELDDRRRAEILATVDRLADLALRPLALAHRPLDETRPPEGDNADAVERDLVHLGVVGIVDPPRTEARAAVAEARRAGVRVVMITGDHQRTAARIASDLGIVDATSTGTLNGRELDLLDDGALLERVGEVSVYARVAPEHKLRIVDALQLDGSIVAMTGDGVNDAPALRAADIGVAMGRTGTDVSRGAADMILADDNFATIIDAIREGRGIFENVRRFLRFLLSSNAGEVLTMFFGVVFADAIGLGAASGAVAVPLLATQILWVNLLTDTAPALALGLDPPPDDVMRRPPRRPDDRVIDGEMGVGVVFVGVVMAIVTLFALDLRLPGGLVHGHGDVTDGRTMAFTTLVLAQLFNAYNARSSDVSAFHRPFTNPALWAAVTLSLLLQIAVVELPALNRAFATRPLSVGDWAWCVTLASGVLWASEARKLVVRRRRVGAERAGE